MPGFRPLLTPLYTVYCKLKLFVPHKSALKLSPPYKTSFSSNSRRWSAPYHSDLLFLKLFPLYKSSFSSNPNFKTELCLYELILTPTKMRLSIFSLKIRRQLFELSYKIDITSPLAERGYRITFKNSRLPHVRKKLVFRTVLKNSSLAIIRMISFGFLLRIVRLL
jgi:hypothetical protein